MASPQETAISVEGVTHRYGDLVALNDVSFAISTGAQVALLGPNGSGKTTLFRILSTLLRPSAGHAHVFGFDTATQAHDVRRQLGIVFQQPALDEALSVAENLQVHGALYGLSGQVLQARIQHLLAAFDLSDRAKSRVKTLSGGLQRRVDLARGLLHHPRVLLLDEPTTGLDPAARRAFWDYLARIRSTEAMTLLMATHLMEEATPCDQVGIMHQGQLVVMDTPAHLAAGVGGETLWVQPHGAAETLAPHIEQALGLTVQVIGGQVQAAHPHAHTLLPALYQACGDQIASATVRQPTLEDVFLVHTGHRLLTP